MISISKFWRLNCDEIGCHGMEDTQQKKIAELDCAPDRDSPWVMAACYPGKKKAGKWDIMGIHWEHHLMYKCITV